MQKQYLTKEKLEEFKKELNDLKSVKRLEIAERLQRAKEMGDLSENSEYFEAREEQALIESRIFELEELLRDVELIKKKPSGDIIQVGSTIEVEKNGQKMTYTIVGSKEANPSTGLISNESPLGQSFLGKKVGEKSIVTLPNGTTEYQIISIK